MAEISYPIPSWINNIPDPVAAYSHGLQIGSQIGTEQARQQMAQEQLLRETQKDLVDQEIEKGKFQLASDQAARNYADQAKFTSLIKSGVDPAQAMLQVPGIGHQTAEMIKAANEGQMTDYQKQEIDLRKKALAQRLTGKEYGDIQTVDLGEGVRAAFRPGSPGLHLIQPPGEKGLTPNAASTLLKSIPEIDAMAGTTGTTNSLAAVLSPSLIDIVKKAVTTPIPLPKGPLSKAVRRKYDPTTGKMVPIEPTAPPPVTVSGTDEED